MGRPPNWTLTHRPLRPCPPTPETRSQQFGRGCPKARCHHIGALAPTRGVYKSAGSVRECKGVVSLGYLRIPGGFWHSWALGPKAGHRTQGTWTPAPQDCLGFYCYPVAFNPLKVLGYSPLEAVRFPALRPFPGTVPLNVFELPPLDSESVRPPPFGGARPDPTLGPLTSSGFPGVPNRQACYGDHRSFAPGGQRYTHRSRLL